MLTSKKLLVVSLAGASVVFAGCQSIEDQIGKQIAQTAIESASGGQVKVDANTGKINVKTSDGDVSMDLNSTGDGINIKSSEGNFVMSGGEQKPAGVPQDLPSLDGAKNFAWLGSSEEGSFTFSLGDANSSDVCNKEIALLTAAGWAEKKESSMTFGDTVTKLYEKTGYSLSVTCMGNKESGETTIMLNKAKAA